MKDNSSLNFKFCFFFSYEMKQEVPARNKTHLIYCTFQMVSAYAAVKSVCYEILEITRRGSYVNCSNDE